MTQTLQAPTQMNLTAQALPEAVAALPLPVLAPETHDAEVTRLLRTVAAGAAHDIAGLLLMIESDLDFVASEWLSPESMDSIRSMRIATSYLRGLTRELRMSTAESAQLVPPGQTQLDVWWPDMAALLHALHREGVVVRADIPPGLPCVRIKAQLLTQVVLNLVGNAVHSVADLVPENALHTGSVGSGKSAEIQFSVRPIQDGQSVSIAITDNGPGMSLEVLARVCEPSFTTRAARGGTGLGLALVQRLVGAAGGSVRFASTMGVGTTVTIEFPTSIGDQTLPGPDRLEAISVEIKNPRSLMMNVLGPEAGTGSPRAAQT
jgi:signal transduction histidine kinase